MKTRLAMLAFIFIALAACTPAATATPTLQPTLAPFISATQQAEQWKKYQTELARVLLAWYGPKYGFPSGLYQSAICEWDIFGRAPQMVYVWAYCSVPSEGIERDAPAVVYLNETGYAQKAEAPGLDSYWADIPRLFPANMQEDFAAYTSSSFTAGKLHEMIAHAKYRQTHPDEPPLIVLTPTPSP